MHFLKVELPDERVLLYRDCVEILTERWQRYKREETGRGDYPAQDLTLAQKTKLLQELAFAMQQRRDIKSSQALLSKRIAVNIISDALVRFFGDDSNEEELYRRAEEWIMGIQTDSGILLEQGLDPDGEPLIGFSHLTFQEYLSAVAIHETPKYFDSLMQNLGNPAWREVIRLYVVLTDDASPIIRALSAGGRQPEGQILAGWCLTERLKKVDADALQTVRGNLLAAFKAGDANLVEVGEILEKTIGVLNVTPFLLEHVDNSNPAIQIAAIQALKGISAGDGQLPGVRSVLISILDSSSSIKARVAAQNTLIHIGDPRFESYTPIMVKVPAYGLNCVKFDDFTILGNDRAFRQVPKNKFLVYLSAWFVSYNEPRRIATRFLTQRLYVLWRKFLLRSKNYVDEFEIARFPVTNLEYSRFVDETGLPAPAWWGGWSYPIEKALHPVTGFTSKSAEKYCQWLSEKTGDDYRLPLEWEWEAAAGLLDGCIYPWGNELDPGKCNSGESELNDTTPVGIYYDVRSPCGIQDSSGNVGEFIRIPYQFHFVWFLTVGLGVFLMALLLTRQLITAALLTFIGLFFGLLFPGGSELIVALNGEFLTKGGSYISKQGEIRSFVRGRWRSTSTLSGSGFRVARYGHLEIESLK